MALGARAAEAVDAVAETSGASATPGPSDTSYHNKQDELQELVVTGSLIPTTERETFTPVLTISTEDITAKGFADIAEALQRTSYATGSVQNGQFVNGFTQGAKTVSFFGLSPAYTKYLIDGVPMADYPELYSGTDVIVNIATIPTVLVDHIDLLPGAQSSIYGSDAIAGVANIVMKKSLDGPIADVRYGWTSGGGGADRRVAIGDGLTVGNFNVVAGAQYESSSPLWGYQRPLTGQYYNQGSTPQTAEQDYAVLGQSNSYFVDPANCANVAGQFGGTVRPASRADLGQYCGTVKSGFFTIENGDEQSDFYLHATLDVNDSLQFYADSLLSHDVVRFNVGPSYYNSNFDSSSPYAYYEDPNLPPDYLNLQHIFSPEEAGGLNNTTEKNTNNSVRGTLGVKGGFGSSWKWLTDFTYSDNKLTEITHLQFTQPIEAFFANIYGPQLGYDSNLGAYLYSPNYGAFFKPLTPAQYNSFSGDVTNYSYTEESIARARVTSTSLFMLPGGDAGLAVQIEGGDQGWNYAPNPLYLDNGTFGYTSTAGSGHRSRYAGTAELSLPIVSMLKADISGRYDDYRVDGQNVDKGTYNLGLEFRPLKELLLRGRYGTAFKAPTLADEFQGSTGYYQQLTDYYACEKGGYIGGTLGNCPQFQQYYYGVTSGNTKLAPITATVWDLGIIATPVERLELSIDYIHFAIRNEVAAIDPQKVVQTESACLLGQLDATSPTCVTALSEVARNDGGAITQINTPKQNVAQENLATFIAEVKYKYDAGVAGEFGLDISFTDIVTHTFQQFAGDPVINYLNDPFYSTEFKTKGNGSLTWTKNPVSVTAYVERYGLSPNYIAQEIPEGYGQAGAGTVAPWTLVDFSIQYQPIKTVEVTFALNNAFNRMPPADHSTPGDINQPYNTSNYNVYGREFYVTATYKMGK